MLHILWLILKFILIILGILLGLLLLAVLLVLFCPVRYKASAVKTEGAWNQIEGEGVVSWLFHGVSLKAEWKDRQMEMSFHLFGIPVDKLLKKRQKKKLDSENTKNTKNTSKKSKSGTKNSRSEAVNSKNEEHESEAKLLNDSADQGVNSTENHTKINENEESIGQDQHKPDNESENTETVTNENKIQPEDTASEEVSEQKTFFIKRIYDRIRNIFKGIRTKLQNIRRTLKKVKNNLSWWKSFLEHPRVKAARTLVWKHAKFLLKHIFPTKIEGQVAFSFENPALTGTALAVLGMTIPFHKNCVQINPRFDGENYLQGNIRAKGRIYGFVFLRAALIIYFDKNIKYVIKRWKTRRA